MEPYGTLQVAEDTAARIGTLGVVTIDQLLVVKHFGGGALVAGDLDSPTITRLPYIESTGGLVCKGAHTPAGFVYGSQTASRLAGRRRYDQAQSAARRLLLGAHRRHYQRAVRRRPRPDGLLGRADPRAEQLCVRHRHAVVVADQSASVGQRQATAPYNCYDVDQQNTMYAWPYRHHAPALPDSHAVFPVGTTGLNCLSIPDSATFSAPSQLDIRFCSTKPPPLT